MDIVDSKKIEQLPLRIIVGTTAVGLLLAFLMFQHINWAAFFKVQPGIWQFIVNRTLRFIINDVLTILLIYALFFNRRYVIFSALIQLLGLVIILIPYFLIKINMPHYNGPMISFLHRLVLNPILLLLLIPVFYWHGKEKNNL